MSWIKPGNETTEYARAKSATWLAYVGLALASLLSYGPDVLGWLPESGPGAPVLAAVIAVAGIVQKTLVDLGYIRSRTEVKVEKQ